jgi:DNA-binding beta-propeller fold protein YncE/ABC-type spermidine/putrescine transport system permease subunit II
MNNKNNFLFFCFALTITTVVVILPALFGYKVGGSTEDGGILQLEPSSTIILRTFGWSFLVALSATIVGWMVGLRVASLSPRARIGMQATLVATLVIPAYAMFYVWWQAWPSGTSFHAYVVEHGYLHYMVRLCLFCALVGWSWPIPALIASMCQQSNFTLSVLHQLDGISFFRRCQLQVQQDWSVLFATVVLVASIVAVNTTCFDLAQEVTIGNELRSVLASGGTAFSAPALSFAGLSIAIVAMIFLLRLSSPKKSTKLFEIKSMFPVLMFWFLLSGLPILIALIATKSDLLQFMKLYSGDLLASATIACGVSILCVCIFVTSAYIHASNSRWQNACAKLMDCVWIVVAFLPASIIVSMYATSWHVLGVDMVFRTPLLVILAHGTKVGFVASLAGRWVASGKNTRTLCALDGMHTLKTFFSVFSPRLLSAGIVVLGISFAVSFGEVALTNQLSPPSTNQPIAVALLHAMHYQRPQMVTSSLFLLICIAGASGIFFFLVHRKIMSIALVLFVVSCSPQLPQTPEALKDATIIGGVGRVDGRFTTPRAIASDEEVLLVIDKTGRLQRFSHDGRFLSSWDLQLDGTGFPTGVSIDDDGLIWIADTHQHRILVIDQEGNEVFHFGEYGTEDGQFLYPTDVAFGSNGEVYVSEYGGNERINVFSREGEFQYSFGHFGKDKDGFIRPQSMAISPLTGNLFITDAGNHRIVERTPTGAFVQIIASAGRDQGEVLFPYGIVFDSSDTFLVCEFGNNRLQRFSTEGESLEVFGGAGDVAGLFKTPWAVVLSGDELIVADTGNNRLQRLPDMMGL